MYEIYLLYIGDWRDHLAQSAFLGWCSVANAWSPPILAGENLAFAEIQIFVAFCMLVDGLVVWNMFYFPFHIWDAILPIDEVVFFKMVIAPPACVCPHSWCLNPVKHPENLSEFRERCRSGARRRPNIEIPTNERQRRPRKPRRKRRLATLGAAGSYGPKKKTGLASGNLLRSYWKWQFFMGKSTISMDIFNSYVSLPEGNVTSNWLFMWLKQESTIRQST